MEACETHLLIPPEQVNMMVGDDGDDDDDDDDGDGDGDGDDGDCDMRRCGDDPPGQCSSHLSR